MNLREAAQMALEALIELDYARTDKSEVMALSAITALRAALAEPEGKAKPITPAEMSAWVKDTWEKCQAEAWFTVEELNKWADKLPQTTHWEGCEAVHPECRKPEPPCKTGASCTNKCPRCAEPEPRKWVSLTDQEMYDLFFNDQYGPRLPEYLVNTIKCVEAALKEKNT